MKLLIREKGASNLTIFLWLLVIFAGLHVGLKWAFVNFDFWRMEDELNTKATLGQVLKDEEIRGGLELKAKQFDLPLKAEHFIIVRNEERKTLSITTAWDTEVRYFWGLCGDPCIRTYHFEPKGEGSYAAGK